MGCRLLRGFYTASYEDCENSVSVEIWGRYDETDKLIDYQLRIHQPDIDSGSGHKTLAVVESLYESNKQYFSMLCCDTEQREITTELYTDLVAELINEPIPKVETVIILPNTLYFPSTRKIKEFARQVKAHHKEKRTRERKALCIA